MTGMLIFLCAGGWYGMILMPGSSYQGTLPLATDELRALEQELHAHVDMLGRQIGERNLFHYDKLLLTAEYIRSEFEAAGYDVRRQEFDVSGKICENIEAEVRGTDRPEDILVIGAHYDSVKGSPGANDNGTGVAAVLPRPAVRPITAFPHHQICCVRQRRTTIFSNTKHGKPGVCPAQPRAE